MDFLSLAKKRYSTRKYTNQKIDTNTLNLVLEAGRVAPTGANNQPQRLIVVQSDEGLELLSQSARFYGAPVCIIVCSDKSAAWVRKTDGKNIADIDASIVTDHMMLQATDLGLASLWMCWFDEKKLRTDFNIPDNLEIVNILAIGYANDEQKSPDRHNTERKPLCETVIEYK